MSFEVGLRRSSRFADQPARNAVQIKYGDDFEGSIPRKPLPPRITTLRNASNKTTGSNEDFSHAVYQREASSRRQGTPRRSAQNSASNGRTPTSGSRASQRSSSPHSGQRTSPLSRTHRSDLSPPSKRHCASPEDEDDGRDGLFALIAAIDRIEAVTSPPHSDNESSGPLPDSQNDNNAAAEAGLAARHAAGGGAQATAQGYGSLVEGNSAAEAATSNTRLRVGHPNMQCGWAPAWEDPAEPMETDGDGSGEPAPSAEALASTSAAYDAARSKGSLPPLHHAASLQHATSLGSDTSGASPSSRVSRLNPAWQPSMHEGADPSLAHAPTKEPSINDSTFGGSGSSHSSKRPRDTSPPSSSPHPSTQDTTTQQPALAKPAQEAEQPDPRRHPVRGRMRDLQGPCGHCGAMTSPQWRKGPKNKPVLCNACGTRYLRTRALGKASVAKKDPRRVQGRRGVLMSGVPFALQALKDPHALPPAAATNHSAPQAVAAALCSSSLSQEDSQARDDRSNEACAPARSGSLNSTTQLVQNFSILASLHDLPPRKSESARSLFVPAAANGALATDRGLSVFEHCAPRTAVPPPLELTSMLISPHFRLPPSGAAPPGHLLFPALDAHASSSQQRVNALTPGALALDAGPQSFPLLYGPSEEPLAHQYSLSAAFPALRLDSQDSAGPSLFQRSLQHAIVSHALDSPAASSPTHTAGGASPMPSAMVRSVVKSGESNSMDSIGSARR